MSDERKVRTEVDGVVYRGRRSVHMSGSRVWIDGQAVGVDNNGDPIVCTAGTLPIAASPRKRPWLQRLLGWSRT